MRGERNEHVRTRTYGGHEERGNDPMKKDLEEHGDSRQLSRSTSSIGKTTGLPFDPSTMVRCSSYSEHRSHHVRDGEGWTCLVCERPEPLGRATFPGREPASQPVRVHADNGLVGDGSPSRSRSEVGRSARRFAEVRG